MFPIIQMRYSFFGQSGWRSDASQQMELLFDPGRLQHRFNLLQQIAMPSLVAQQDRDFGLVVLTSADLPRPHLTALTEFVGDMLGDRAEVIARKPSSAHRQFMRFNKENFAPDQTILQIVLDDDDALSTDFIGRIREEAALMRQRLPADQTHFYLSMSRGVSLVFKPGDPYPDLFTRDVPYTNLGLTLVSPAGTRAGPYGIAHKKLARSHASFVYNDLKPYYIRAVHGANDSRAIVNEEYPVKPEDMPELLERFPLLRKMLAPEVVTAAG